MCLFTPVPESKNTKIHIHVDHPRRYIVKISEEYSGPIVFLSLLFIFYLVNYIRKHICVADRSLRETY